MEFHRSECHLGVQQTLHSNAKCTCTSQSILDSCADPKPFGLDRIVNVAIQSVERHFLLGSQCAPLFSHDLFPPSPHLSKEKPQPSRLCILKTHSITLKHYIAQKFLTRKGRYRDIDEDATYDFIISN